MKRIISFGVLFFSAYVLQAQSNSFNLTDTIVTINNVYTYYYDTNSYPLTEIYNPCNNRFNAEKIDSLKHFLRSNPTVHIEIGWHTDQRGSSQYNKSYSNRCAAKLKGILIDSSISADRISAVGFGETKPIYDDKAIELMLKTEDKERAYERNRRIVIRIIKL